MTKLTHLLYGKFEPNYYDVYNANLKCVFHVWVLFQILDF